MAYLSESRSESGLMDQQSLSFPHGDPASGETGLRGNAPHATEFLPVQMSSSGALLLGPYQTKDAYMERLHELKQTKSTLEKGGYVVQALTGHDLAHKRKCQRCHKLIFKAPKYTGNRNPKPKPSGHTVGEPRTGHTVAGVATSGPLAALPGGNPSDKTSAKEPQHDCRYHDGNLNGRIWSCCRAGIYSKTCKSSAEHLAAVYQPGELEEAYRYYTTPAATPSISPCLAVAIDCEMGTSVTNSPVLIRVTLVDYFTSEVLVDRLVFPDEPPLHYNTRFSGVTYNQMARARSRGECLYGNAGARNAIWRFVGPETIVVAHSGQNDLSVMRWIHGNIVDTFLLESLPVVKLQREAREKAERERSAGGLSEAKQRSPDTKPPAGEPTKKKKNPKGSGQFSLKTLSRVRLDRDIQVGNGGHDSVEDAIAARDIAHWNVLNFGHGIYEIQNSTD